MRLILSSFSEFLTNLELVHPGRWQSVQQFRECDRIGALLFCIRTNVENQGTDIRHELICAPVTRKSGLQLPTGTQEGMPACVLNVHEEVKMGAYDQVGCNGLAFTACDLTPQCFRIQTARPREARTAAQMMGKVQDRTSHVQIQYFLTMPTAEIGINVGTLNPGCYGFQFLSATPLVVFGSLDEKERHLPAGILFNPVS